MRALVIAVVLAGSTVGVSTAPAVNAAAPATPTSTLCELVVTNAAVVGYHVLGGCESYNGPVLCHSEDVNLNPTPDVFVEVCVPVPFAAGGGTPPPAL